MGSGGETSDGESAGLVLRLTGITKKYPGVTALKDVRFVVNAHEIVGLVGENGAGKSTLMKILIGLIQPDEGSFVLRGTGISLRDPTDAIRNGIGMVFQEGSLVPNLTVRENLFLCHEHVSKNWAFSRRAECATWQRLCSKESRFG